MEQIYVAKVWNQQGRIIYKTTALHATREAAAKEAFQNCPKADECSTSRGFIEEVAGRRMTVDYGRDTRWMRRDDVMGEFAEPEGMVASRGRKAAAKATADKYTPRADKSGKGAAKTMLTPSVMKGRADKYITKDGSKPDAKAKIGEAAKVLIATRKEYSGTADDVREEWLRKAAKLMHKWFAVAGYDMPAYRVSVGWTSKGVRTKRIGECWDKSASADGSYQIFISPTQADTTMVLGILAHELIHAVVGLKAKHGPKFKQCGIDACGFEGKAAHMHTGARFLEQVKPIIDKLGEFPHAAMRPGQSSTGKKQPTRMIKCQCGSCGYTVRTTEKWLALATPDCPNRECDSYAVEMSVG